MVWRNTYPGPDFCSATIFRQITSEVPWYKQDPTPFPQNVQLNLLMAPAWHIPAWRRRTRAAQQGIYRHCVKRQRKKMVKGKLWSIKTLCERAALFTGVNLSCDCGILPFSSDEFHFTALKERNKLRVMLF